MRLFWKVNLISRKNMSLDNYTKLWQQKQAQSLPYQQAKTDVQARQQACEDYLAKYLKEIEQDVIAVELDTPPESKQSTKTAKKRAKTTKTYYVQARYTVVKNALSYTTLEKIKTKYIGQTISTNKIMAWLKDEIEIQCTKKKWEIVLLSIRPKEVEIYHGKVPEKIIKIVQMWADLVQEEKALTAQQSAFNQEFNETEKAIKPLLSENPGQQKFYLKREIIKPSLTLNQTFKILPTWLAKFESTNDQIDVGELCDYIKLNYHTYRDENKKTTEKVVHQNFL